MQNIADYILDHYLNDLVGSRGNVDFNTSDGLRITDLKLKHERLRRAGQDKSDSGIDLTSGTIGSLYFKAADFGEGKLQVVATDVIFEFSIEPLKALGHVISNARDAAASSKPGFVRAMPEGRNAQWDALMGRCHTERPDGDRVRPEWCAMHHKPERRRRGQVRVAQCKSCGNNVQTNYVMCGLCPTCSNQLGRCVLCGDPEVVQTRQDLEEEFLGLPRNEIDMDDDQGGCGVGVPSLLDNSLTAIADKSFGFFRCGANSEASKVRQSANVDVRAIPSMPSMHNRQPYATDNDENPPRNKIQQAAAKRLERLGVTPRGAMREGPWNVGQNTHSTMTRPQVPGVQPPVIDEESSLMCDLPSQPEGYMSGGSISPTDLPDKYAGGGFMWSNGGIPRSMTSDDLESIIGNDAFPGPQERRHTHPLLLRTPSAMFDDQLDREVGTESHNAPRKTSFVGQTFGL